MMLQSKIHRAIITHTDPDYEGSISIDATLLQSAQILPNQQVDIYDITNGERFTTYAISGKAGDGAIQINGAAAKKVSLGDVIIICAYCSMDRFEAERHQPRVILLNDQNKEKYDTALA